MVAVKKIQKEGFFNFIPKKTYTSIVYFIKVGRWVKVEEKFATYRQSLIDEHQ